MKREKLCLLSRFPTSPPNPTVSGGYFLLHHGGSSLLLEGSLPLRNEGPLLSHRDSTPHPPPLLLHRCAVNDFVPQPYLPTNIPPPIYPSLILMTVASNHHHRNRDRHQIGKLWCDLILLGTFTLPSLPAARPSVEPPPSSSTRKVFGGSDFFVNPLIV
ncbi:hypothetical protein OROMI_027280 [Orobanche minor]